MPELEKLFDEWAAKHEKLISQKKPYSIDHEPPFGKFVRDGVVNMDEWKKQKLRVCFILPEASGFNDSEKFSEGADVAELWNEKGSFTATTLMLATWARAVQDSVIAPVPYPKKSIYKHKNELIRSTAVVNLKKSDGQLQPNYDLLKNFIREDAAEIRQELEIIRTNIILCSVDFKSLVGSRPAEETEETKRQFVFYDDEVEKIGSRTYKWGKNKLIFDLWSPAQHYKPSSSKLLNYYTVRELCRAGIKSFQETAKKATAKSAENTSENTAAQPAETKTAKADKVAKTTKTTKTAKTKKVDKVAE